MKSPWKYDENIPCVCWYPVVPVDTQIVLEHWLFCKCPRHSPLPHYHEVIKEYIDNGYK